MLFVFAGLSPCKHASAEKFEAQHLVTKHPRGLGLHGDDLCSQRPCRPRFRLRSCYQLFHRDDGAFAEPRLVLAREVDFPRCKAFLEDAAVVIALQQSWFWASSRVQYTRRSQRGAPSPASTSKSWSLWHLMPRPRSAPWMFSRPGHGACYSMLLRTKPACRI